MNGILVKLATKKTRTNKKEFHSDKLKVDKVTKHHKAIIMLV